MDDRGPRDTEGAVYRVPATLYYLGSTLAGDPRLKD